MNPVTMVRRHPLLWLFGLLMAGAALWIGYFLATFDLDHYRDQVAGELAARLQVPVQLGMAHVELREAGIAFRFSDLQIGTAETRAELHAETLWLQLAWHGLLFGRPVLTEVALDTPHLRIRPPGEQPAEEVAPRQKFRLESLSGLRVRRVEIHHGAIEAAWRYPSGAERVLAIDDLSVEIADLGGGRTVAFDATGSLVEQGALTRLALNGSVALPASGTLAEAGWDVILETKDFEPDRIARLLPDQTMTMAGETGKLTLIAKGKVADGLTLQVDLAGNGLSLRSGTPASRQLPFKHLQIAGTWQRQEDTHQIRRLTAQLDGLRLTGEVDLHPGADGYQATVRLADSTLPLDSLRPWIPDHVAGNRLSLEKLHSGGVFALRQATVHVSLPAAAGTSTGVAIERLNGELTDLGWSITPERAVSLEQLQIRFESGRWQLDRGKAAVAGLPITFSGIITPREGASPQLAVELAGSGTATQLASLWPRPLPDEIILTGDLKMQGRLNGPPELLAVEVRVDLAGLDVRYGDRFHLPPTPGAGLVLQGQIADSSLTFTPSSLTWPPLSGQFSGSVDWNGPTAVQLTALLESPDLATAGSIIPTLDKLKLRGAAALEVKATGPVEALQTRTSLQLRDVTIPTHGIVADISRLNGLLHLESGGVRSEKLTARLGRSPVILQARVPDLKSPRLELGVKAAGIRADELIFYSDRTMLRDVSGQLFIDGDGIDFAPVNVRLDGGTRATVRGSVKDFGNPRVELDISGEYANVKEIIGLWTDESPTAEAARKAHRAGTPHKLLPPVSIRAEARQGDLYGMKFANARALIVPTSEQLLIHPLDFNVAEGYCTTQVLVDYSGRHPLLRVSGHVENVDAYEVVNELLKRKSIMRGSLRGDFYLQGELGEGRFLPTSFGNINATVRDGVMRHSPVLSTIFSLLNVSQLFSFKLPDVNLEGVPFTRVAAELAIDKGILSSDLIVIDSEAMNMSYVGQYDMIKDRLDLLVVVKPLGTIDKVVTSLPIAGWILGGEEQALITAQFKVTGPGAAPEIEAIPISAMSKGVLGIFQRTLSLPLKLIEDPAILWGGGGKKP